MANPPVEAVADAIEQWAALGSHPKAGSWEVTLSPINADLDKFNAKDAEKIRALGRTLNTKTFCRGSANDESPPIATRLKSAVMPGYRLEQLRGGPGYLSYKLVHEGDRYSSVQEVEYQTTDDTLLIDQIETTYRGRVNGSPDGQKKIRIEGRRIGLCSGPSEYMEF